jgi:hypothetical protein
MYLWLFIDGRKENGTHFSLCASDQTNAGWVSLFSIQAVNSRLKAY